jgi:hypothetical protein
MTGNVELAAIREIYEVSPSFYSVCEDQVTRPRTLHFVKFRLERNKEKREVSDIFRCLFL